MSEPAPIIEPMILELIDGKTTDPHGDMNVYVEVRHDGNAMLRGPIEFPVTGFVEDCTWTLRYPWKDRKEPDVAFRLPEVKDADPFTVVSINSVLIDTLLPQERQWHEEAGKGTQ